MIGVSPTADRFEESDAMLQLANKMVGVRSRPAADSTEYAARVEDAGKLAADLAERLDVSLEGLVSSGVELDMDSSDELLALRDALAEGESLRKEAAEWDDAAEKSRRLRRGFFGEEEEES